MKRFWQGDQISPLFHEDDQDDQAIYLIILGGRIRCRVQEIRDSAQVPGHQFPWLTAYCLCDTEKSVRTKRTMRTKSPAFGWGLFRGALSKFMRSCPSAAYRKSGPASVAKPSCQDCQLSRGRAQRTPALCGISARSAAGGTKQSGSKSVLLVSSAAYRKFGSPRNDTQPAPKEL
jgi:hypothetical protein